MTVRTTEGHHLTAQDRRVIRNILGTPGALGKWVRTSKRGKIRYIVESDPSGVLGLFQFGKRFRQREWDGKLYKREEWTPVHVEPTVRMRALKGAAA